MSESRHNLKISRKPLSDYGSLEGMIRGIRDHRPLDLHAEALGWFDEHLKG